MKIVDVFKRCSCFCSKQFFIAYFDIGRKNMFFIIKIEAFIRGFKLGNFLSELFDWEMNGENILIYLIPNISPFQLVLKVSRSY